MFDKKNERIANEGGALMKITFIEPTPSPNTMKLHLDESLPKGIQRTYTKENKEMAPEWARRLLEIDGVKSIFRTADFIALDRVPNGDWEKILTETRIVFGQQEDIPGQSSFQSGSDDSFGEVKVYVQTFRKIPMQIRVKSDGNEVRKSLPDSFVQAAMEAGMASANLIKERKLEDYGIRYGEPEEIAEEVIRELTAAYPEDRLKALVEKAKEAGLEGEVIETVQTMTLEEIKEAMNSGDWRVRYGAFEQLKPTEQLLPLIEKALQDPHTSIRRLAVVYLGDIGGKIVLPYLYRALKDKVPSVRRTAGDTLSDLGDPDAIEAMAEALQDSNKIVRWRAARFLYEVGDERALEALRRAKDDPEFEIRLQVNMALERIEKGEEAEGTIWQQMTNRRRD